MNLGDLVEKVGGYKWPGVIVASFCTTKGKHRFVVECLIPEVAGGLRIFAAEQLRPLSAAQIDLLNRRRELYQKFGDAEAQIEPPDVRLIADLQRLLGNAMATNAPTDADTASAEAPHPPK